MLYMKVDLTVERPALHGPTTVGSKAPIVDHPNDPTVALWTNWPAVAQPRAEDQIGGPTKGAPRCCGPE